MSKTRKIYIARLVGRCLLLGVCLWMCFFYRQAFSVLEGMHFFTNCQPLALPVVRLGHGYGVADHPHPQQGAAGIPEAVCQPLPSHP